MCSCSRKWRPMLSKLISSQSLIFSFGRKKDNPLFSLCAVEYENITRHPYMVRCLENNQWSAKDTIARVLGWTSLYVPVFWHITDVLSAEEMWSSILNRFIRWALLKEIGDWGEFYTGNMIPDESRLTYIIRRAFLESLLKSIGVIVDD